MTGLWVLHDYKAKVIVERDEQQSRVSITVNGDKLIMSTDQARIVAQALDMIFQNFHERKVTYGR